MMDDQAPPGTDPIPATLLPNRTATIQFDGLIIGAYDQKRSLYQAAVHTDAENHHVELTVTQNNQQIFPKSPDDWDGRHETVKARAPFWLFVDWGNGLDEANFNATLNKIDDPNDPLSFGKIFNFEREYGRKLPLHPERFAEFNFPHGTSYSALNTEAQVERVDNPSGGVPPSFVRKINVSTLGAIDIDQAGEGEQKVELVLISMGEQKEFFRLPLVAGSTYEVKLFNIPDANHVHGHTAPPTPEQHFLQYYELFSLNRQEKPFLVAPAESATPTLFGNPGSPPCITGSGNTEGGLGGS